MEDAAGAHLAASHHGMERIGESELQIIHPHPRVDMQRAAAAPDRGIGRTACNGDCEAIAMAAMVSTTFYKITLNDDRGASGDVVARHPRRGGMMGGLECAASLHHENNRWTPRNPKKMVI